MAWLGELYAVLCVSAALVAGHLDPWAYIVDLTFVLVTLAGVLTWDLQWLVSCGDQTCFLSPTR